MKLAIASRHNPHREGSPTGRCFWAFGEGLVAEGHTVDAICWAPEQPRDDLPPWCRWVPIPAEPRWRTRARALARPRYDVGRVDWAPDADAVAIAEDPVSYAAVARMPRNAVVFHYLTRLDVPATGRRMTPKDVQDVRHERRAARTSPCPLAFSRRVAGVVGRASRVVPIAYPIPAEPLPVVDEPVAVLLANWEWPPNAPALALLLEAWPEVRRRVPGARLRLAGWGLDRMGVGSVPGVELVGSVARSVDALDGAAVLAFPCPPSSGPKVKVLEALAHGVPVVTTEAGAEGLVAEAGRDLVVAEADAASFADALAGVLGDDARRGGLAVAGRDAAVGAHAPAMAARARVAALESVLLS